MKVIIIPKSMGYPTVDIWVNGKEYTFPSGVEITVDAYLAEVIENAIALAPKEGERPSGCGCGCDCSEGGGASAGGSSAGGATWKKVVLEANATLSQDFLMDGHTSGELEIIAPNAPLALNYPDFGLTFADDFFEYKAIYVDNQGVNIRHRGNNTNFNYVWVSGGNPPGKFEVAWAKSNSNSLEGAPEYILTIYYKFTPMEV